MSESQDRPLKATLKAGGGFEAPWLTIDADNAEDLYNRLQDVTAHDGQLLAKIAEVAEQLRAAHTVYVTPASQPASSGFGSGATQTHSEPAPSGQVKTCPHGTRTRREGNGSKGKWVGYFCPLPKGDPNQCKPEWEDNK